MKSNERISEISSLQRSYEMEKLMRRKTDDDDGSKTNSLWLLINFKRIVRKVIIHRHWLTHDIIPEAERTRASYKDATIAFNTRVALMRDPKNRTDEDIALIVNMLQKINELAFFIDKQDMAKVANEVTFQVVDSGRIVVHEHHAPEAMYGIITGNAQIFVGGKTGQDDILEKQVWSTSSEGNCFGGYDLFMDELRVFSVKALSRLELIIVPKDVFHVYIYPQLRQHFDQIRALIQPLHYFDTYDPVDLNQIYFFSEIYMYAKNEILTSPQMQSNDTFIIINGRCDLIETLFVRRQESGYGSKLGLMQITGNADIMSTRTVIGRDKHSHYENNFASPGELTPSRSMHSDYANFMKHSTTASSRMSLTSVNRTSTMGHLFHSSRQTPNLLLRNVEKHYMKIASYSNAACFNVGEIRENRIIICTCETVCLLIPQHFLQHHHSNIWEKVRQYLDQTIPNTVQIYTSFIKTRQYRKLKKELVQGILQRQRFVPSNNCIANVPFSLRLRYDYEFTDQYHHSLTASDFNVKHRERKHQSFQSRDSD